MTLMRPCLDCGTPADGTRCQECEAARPKQHNFGTRHNRAYDTRAYRNLRASVVKRHIRQHGLVCPGYNRSPHPADRLELDHITPLAQGGSLTDRANAQVLCPSCNRAKSGGRGGNP